MLSTVNGSTTVAQWLTGHNGDLDLLSEDVLIHLCTFLDVDDLCRLSGVNYSLRHLCLVKPHLWNRLIVLKSSTFAPQNYHLFQRSQQNSTKLNENEEKCTKNAMVLIDDFAKMREEIISKEKRRICSRQENQKAWKRVHLQYLPLYALMLTIICFCVCLHLNPTYNDVSGIIATDLLKISVPIMLILAWENVKRLADFFLSSRNQMMTRVIGISAFVILAFVCRNVLSRFDQSQMTQSALGSLLVLFFKVCGFVHIFQFTLDLAATPKLRFSQISFLRWTLLFGLWCLISACVAEMSFGKVIVGGQVLKYLWTILAITISVLWMFILIGMNFISVDALRSEWFIRSSLVCLGGSFVTQIILLAIDCNFGKEDTNQSKIRGYVLPFCILLVNVCRFTRIKHFCRRDYSLFLATSAFLFGFYTLFSFLWQSGLSSLAFFAGLPTSTLIGSPVTLMVNDVTRTIINNVPRIKIPMYYTGALYVILTSGFCFYGLRFWGITRKKMLSLLADEELLYRVVCIVSVVITFLYSRM